MLRFPDFQVDQISFWLGFLAASLFWWIISKIKGYLPALQGYLRQRKEAAQKKSLSALEILVRQETLRRSQYQHIAFPLFPLDEILVPPRLIPPPAPFDPEQDSRPVSLIDQTIPYFPDCPELSAHYSISTISPQQLIESKVNVALIGTAGSGKTVTLAHIATLIAKSDPETDSIASIVPILLHILEINYEKAQEAENLLGLISEAYTGFLPLTAQPRFSRFLQNIVLEGRALILLDGLDELPPADLEKAVLFLKLLLEKYPTIRVITTISPDHLGGLGLLPIHLVGIAAWNQEERRRFFDLWGKQWNTYLAPGIQKKYSLEPLNPHLITNWLLGENRHYTPLEWTLLIWAIYAGDIAEIKLHSALDAYLQRLTGTLLPQQALEKLALDMCYNHCLAYRYGQIEKFFAKYTPDTQDQSQPDEEMATNLKRSSGKRQPSKVSSSGRAINSLLELGLFTEHIKEQIRFTHPLVMGYLASCATESADERILNHQCWQTKMIAAQFMIGLGRATQWVKDIVVQQDFPFYKNLILCAKAAKDIHGEEEWKAVTMRRLVELLHDDKIPLLARSRLLAILVSLNDPLVATLLRQLLRSSSTCVRQLAALGCGALQDSKAVPELTGLMADNSEGVRNAACLALSAIGTPSTRQAIVAALMNGQESLRQVAAETLAANPPEGHQYLKEAVKSDDLMTRWAAVYGLSLVQETWVPPLLEKISIEDGQWVVRNAAMRALEKLQQPPAKAFVLLPPPHESPWLIAFASKLGIGLSVNQPVTEPLLTALKEGSPEERLAAMEYLKIMPQRETMLALCEIVALETGVLQESAYSACWHLAMIDPSLITPLTD